MALGLHVLVGFFPYAASGLLAPLYGVVALFAVWAVLLLVAWRWRPANPWAVLIVPVAAVAAWFLLISLGDWLLGWTA